jgi:hypothetical protein
MKTISRGDEWRKDWEIAVECSKRKKRRKSKWKTVTWMNDESPSPQSRVVLIYSQGMIDVTARRS